MSALSPTARSVAARGWLPTHRYLLLRRLSQLSVLGLFLLGPWAGMWLIRGNLASSQVLGVLDLTDPFVFIQSLAAGHAPLATAVTGVLIVTAFYLLVGGRVYCSWVCPINPITDAAGWLRRRLGLRGGARLRRSTRWWLLGAVLLLASVTGSLAWELINPVSLLHRGLIFGMGLGWVIILAIFLFDLFVSPRGWCGHLCPMGACYAVINAGGVLRVRADQRQDCDDCGDCYQICPEPQVLVPALKGAKPVVSSLACTNCGRCIDVCHVAVFRFGSRFAKAPTEGEKIERTKTSPGGSPIAPPNQRARDSASRAYP